jgi:hypothetical protein
MPAADLDVPVSPSRWYLVAPGSDDDWAIARHLENLAHEIAEHVACERFDQAAKLTDELADAVRAMRDSPLGLLIGKPLR